MSTKYLLPCECGKTVPVATFQAGDDVRCSCGLSLHVPSIMGLKKLQAVDDGSTPKVKRAPGWSPLQGVMFALGMLILVGSLLPTAYWAALHYQSIPFTKSTDAEESKYFNVEVDKMKLLDSVKLWEEATKQGLGDQEVPMWLAISEATVKYRSNWILASSVAGVGLLLIIFSFFAAPKPKRRPAPKAAK